MKLWLLCPGCKARLPQIGNEPLRPGEAVECGMCGHGWIPIPKRKTAPDPELELQEPDSRFALAVLILFTPVTDLVRQCGSMLLGLASSTAGASTSGATRNAPGSPRSDTPTRPAAPTAI